MVNLDEIGLGPETFERRRKTGPSSAPLPSQERVDHLVKTKGRDLFKTGQFAAYKMPGGHFLLLIKGTRTWTAASTWPTLSALVQEIEVLLTL